MINIKNFDPNLLRIDKKSYESIDIYYIGYISVKDSEYVKIKIVNPLYLIINEVDGYVEDIDGSKYLTLVSTDKNKEVLTKYTELWNGIKNSFEIINNKSDEYGKDFMRSVFEEDGKYYECLYKL